MIELHMCISHFGTEHTSFSKGILYVMLMYKTQSKILYLIKSIEFQKPVHVSGDNNLRSQDNVSFKIFS